MKMILAATALVQVIGIALVSDRLPNDTGVHIVLPHLTGPMAPSTPIQLQPANSRFQQSDIALVSQRFSDQFGQPSGPVVEKHDATIVAFRAENLVRGSVSGWEVKTLPGFPDTQYIELKNDRFRFIGNASNPQASMAGLQLPKMPVTGTCRALAAISPGYQHPYRAAIGVIDVPHGQLSACRAMTTDDRGRIDTRLSISYDSNLLVEGGTMMTYKHLRLKAGSTGGLHVLVLNIPKRILEGDTSRKALNATDGMRHFMAYYDMGSGSTSGCTDPPPPASGIPACAKTWITDVGKNEAIERVVQVDFECSNTQWP